MQELERDLGFDPEAAEANQEIVVGSDQNREMIKAAQVS